MLHRVKIQHVKDIMIRLLPLLPLCHLNLAQIMRRIHIARSPTPRDLLTQIICQIVTFQFLDVVVGAGSDSRSSFALFACGVLQESADACAASAVSRW